MACSWWTFITSSGIQAVAVPVHIGDEDIRQQGFIGDSSK